MSSRVAILRAGARAPLRALGAAVLTTALGALPRAAAACAVCGVSDDEEVRQAFLWTTGFLSLLPLLIVGAVVFFVRRFVLARAAERAEREAGASGATAGPGARPAAGRGARPGSVVSA